jgi:hypothetical protein
MKKGNIVSGPNRRELGSALFGSGLTSFIVEVEDSPERISVQASVTSAKATGFEMGRTAEVTLEGSCRVNGGEIPQRFEALYHFTRDKHFPKFVGSCYVGREE